MYVFIQTSKTSKSQICKKKRQMILNKLQQVTVSYVNDNSNDFGELDLTNLSLTLFMSHRSINNNWNTVSSDRAVLPRARNLTRTSPESGNHRSTQTDAHGFGKNDTYDDYTCYRCKHFTEIPRNLSLPLCKTAPAFIGRCEAELNFVQAIVWLKSATASVSQISVEQLRRIFDRQWQDAYDNGKYHVMPRICLMPADCLLMWETKKENTIVWENLCE